MISFEDADRLIKKGNIKALGLALDDGLSPDCKNRNSWSLLMSAAQKGNLPIGELLISKGADVNHAVSQGLNGCALNLAIMGGHIPFIRFLLEHGASTAYLGPVDEWMKYSGLSQSKMAAILKIFSHKLPT